jgi:hypothetical protein
MFIVEDVWKHIKSFVFHNIKIHGKHLKNEPYNINYNHVMKNIPKPSIPFNGPRIIYSSAISSTRFVKYIYHMIFPNFWKNFNIRNASPYGNRTIIEIQMLNNEYDADYLTHDSKFREEYFNQYK